MPCDGFMVRIAFAPLWGALVGRYRPQHVFADHGAVGLFSGTPQQIYRFSPAPSAPSSRATANPFSAAGSFRRSAKINLKGACSPVQELSARRGVDRRLEVGAGHERRRGREKRVG